MRRPLLDRPGSGLLAVSVFGLALGAAYLVATMQLEVGTLAEPGPGFFPVAVGVLFLGTAVLAAVEAVTELRRGPVPAVEEAEPEDVVATPRVGAGFACLVAAFVILLPLLGQYLASVLFLVAAIRVVGHRSWPRTLFVGTAVALTVSVLFVEVLGVPMPAGVLALEVTR
jgi:putative tricarboxylic transport membrane protein